MDAQRPIVPRKIKGFRDIDPALNMLRWKIIHAATRVYRLYGYEHWDSPALEYADNLGKYLPDSDTVEAGVYYFKNPEKEPVLDAVGRELRDEWDKVVMDNHFLALRYDLTAPLARIYSEKYWHESLRGELITDKAPLFRRYQFGPVFRFEAKLDPGRFREFWQLDFDTVGSVDPITDAESCMVFADAMEAIGLPRGSYIVKLNNRKILKGFIGSLGDYAAGQEQSILRIIDKRDKIGLEGVEQELGKGRPDASGAFIEGLKMDPVLIRKLVSFFGSLTTGSKRNTVLEQLRAELGGFSLVSEGLDELEQIDTILTSLGFGEDRITIDPTLVRGMGYYTGPVFEVESNLTFTDEKGRTRKVGSVCGGGRYDGLVERMLGIRIPATGGSVGIDRLAELLSLTGASSGRMLGPVFIPVFDARLMPEYQRLAFRLREQGIETEIYYGMQKGLKKQLSYADRKNCSLALFMGEDELKKGIITVKDLQAGRENTQLDNKEEWKRKVQVEVPAENIVDYLKSNGFKQ